MQGQKPPETAASLADRKARSAEALRRNLKRRKDQARERQVAAPQAEPELSTKVHKARPIG